MGNPRVILRRQITEKFLEIEWFGGTPGTVLAHPNVAK